MMKAKAVIVILVALLAAPAVGSGMTVGSGPALGGSGATVAVGSGMTTAIGSGLSVACYSGLTVAVGKVPGDWDSPYDLPPTTALQIPVTALLQYQRVKATRGSAFAPFRKYGLRPIAAHDAQSKLWGYHVAIDTTRTTAEQPYRRFAHHDLYSFAVIDGVQPDSPAMYVFWWKGYYRHFAAQLRQRGFRMSNVTGQTNVLRFSKPDVNVIVDFIIWDDIYVMRIK